MTDPKTRRFFLGAVTAAAATRVWGANDKINIAIIGLGGRGTNHLNQYSHLPESRVAVLCDVNQAAREVAQATLAKGGFEKAKEFEDMRQAFADPGVDAVSIATPNHWHALAAIWAMKAGKDVYGEKPACYNIYEGIKMVEVQRATGKLMQMGSQHRSTPFKMKAIAAMQQGLIGKIYLAKGLCFKRRNTIGHAENEPTPPGVNWDLFLGPAPMRPFNKLRFKYNWHWFWDTGNGDIGNQGVHEMGIARWGLGDPEWPKTAYAFGGKYAYQDDQETPNTLLAGFTLRRSRTDVRSARPADGRRRHSATPHGAWRRGTRRTRRGTACGASGRSRSDHSRAGQQSAQHPDRQPVLRHRRLGGDERSGLPGVQGREQRTDHGRASRTRTAGGDATGLHMQNFLQACKSRNIKDLHDPLSNAVHSANLCHLANISYRSGRKLTIEAGPKFAGDAEATKMISRDVYRKPYVV